MRGRRASPSCPTTGSASAYREFTVRKQVVRPGRGTRPGASWRSTGPGPTMRLVDPATGEVSKVYLFVACLPFSRMSYVEPTLT